MNATITAGEGLQKLVAEGTSGNFVRQNQEMASKDGFKFVSKKWYAKTISYEQGMQALAEGKAKTKDLVATVAQMVPEIGQDGRFRITHKPSGQFFRPTKYAVCQMGTWAGTGRWFVQNLMEHKTKPNGDILFLRDKTDADVLVRALTNGFRRIDQTKDFLWRTRDDGTIRAMLTPKYAIVDNCWFIESLSKLVPGGRLSHWRGDENTIFGNVLIPDSIREEQDSDYGGMVSVGNSEIGERRVSSLPSVFRAICQNGCIWDQKVGKGIKQIHRGKIDLEQLFLSMKENLELQIPLIPQGIEKLLGSRRLRWDGASMLPIFAQVASENKLTKRQASALLAAYNTERTETPDFAKTLFGVVNAVTRAGQGLNNNEWVRFDSIGGKLASMNENSWQILTGRAKSLSAKEVEAAFSSVA